MVDINDVDHIDPQNEGMEPAIILGGFVALALLLLAAAMRRTRRPSGRAAPPFRRAAPWVAGGVLVVGAGLLAIPGVSPVVIAVLPAYAGVAIAGMWRMASLDSVSPWMPPSRRRARLGATAIAVTWLGLVLGLLLAIVDLVARTRYGP